MPAMSALEASKTLVQSAFSPPSAWATNLARARALIEAALEQAPADTLLLTALGAVLCDQGKHEDAVAALRRAAELGSADRNTYFNLAVAILNAGNHEEAMTYFAKANTLSASAQTWEAYLDPQAH